MFSLKPLLIGLILVALGVAGFVYNLTRPLPPVEWATPEFLPTATPDEPAASPTPTPHTQDLPHQGRIVTVRRIITSAPTPLPTPPTITLTTPPPGTTYTAPATVALNAEVSPRTANVRKVEFFYAQASGNGSSFCNTVKGVELPAATLTRLGEVRGSPYHFTWENVAEGNYVIYGIVTDGRGVRQVSQPGFVSVNSFVAEGKRKGWRPSYRLEQLARELSHITATPTPTPTPPCLTVAIEAPSDERQEGQPATLTARVTEAGENDVLLYNWKLSAGRIISGQGTNTVTLDTQGLGGQTVEARLEVINTPTLCMASSSQGIQVFQSLELEHIRRLRGTSLFSRLDNFAGTLQNDPENQGYIIAYGRVTGCDGEAAFSLREAKNYLIKKRGIKPESIVTIDGGYQTDTKIELWLVPAGAAPPDVNPSFTPEEAHTRRCSASDMSALLYEAARPLDAPYPKCPNVDERVDYNVIVGANASTLNICPYNLKDPQTEEPQLNLSINALGVYGNKLTYQYWTNGGQVLAEEKGARWDLSAVRLQPGYYTAIVAATDECGCTSIASTSVLLTNFCTPCLSVSYECPATPEKSRTSMRFNVNPEEWALENPPTYRWRVSQGTIIEGQGTTSILVDTSKLDKGTEVVATVEVGGFYQYCLKEEVASGIVGEECAPTPTQFDTYGRIRDRDLRRARTRGQGQKTVISSEVEVSGGEGVGGQTTTPTPTPATGELAEKEYIKLAWPKSVEIQRSATIVVRYERTTATLNLSNQQGDVTEQLSLPRLLKDRYGPDYVVWANAKLRSAGFDCDGCDEEQYQRLDNTAQVEWSWNIISERSGTQTFNVELWVEGRPRSSRLEKKLPEKVWSRNNLELFVKESQPTRNTIIASSVLLCLFGLGFSLKGIKIHIGDRIGGDKFTGDKIGGDKVLGNKGDVYNVEHGVGVGRGVKMEDTNVNQDREEAE